MTISERIFYRYIPSATNPEGAGIYEMVQDDLAVANSVLRSLLGVVLSDKLNIAQGDDHSPLYNLTIAAERYICLSAYDRAIPSLDLVLTPTGFGVVSNANVAPASAERVAKLARSVRDMKECALDDLLDMLRGNEDWCDTPVAKHYFQSLIWSGRMMAHFGFPDEYRTKLAELSPKIAEVERTLVHIISPELHVDLTAAVRTNSTNESQLMAIHLCREYIYSHFSGMKLAVERAKGSLINYLDFNIDSFPAYKNSSAYIANHYKNYENKQEDSCYFFG